MISEKLRNVIAVKTVMPEVTQNTNRSCCTLGTYCSPEQSCARALIKKRISRGCGAICLNAMILIQVAKFLKCASAVVGNAVRKVWKFCHSCILP